MFQYATGRAIATALDTGLLIDTTEYLVHSPQRTKRRFALKDLSIPSLQLFTRRGARYFGSHRWPLLSRFLMHPQWFRFTHPQLHLKTEMAFGYDETLLEVGNNTYLDGYWQSYKYFRNLRNILIAEFQVSLPPSVEDLVILEQMQYSNSISLHIRRGDYVQDSRTNANHGVCSREYYEAAVAMISEGLTAPHIFVFSDEPEWAKRNVLLWPDTTIVEHNNEADDHQDFRLMSHCRHHIIANSTFSWWAAWISAHQDKRVIAPRNWFRHGPQPSDLIPPEWEQL